MYANNSAAMRSRVDSWYTFHRGKMCLPIDSTHKVSDKDTEEAIAPKTRIVAIWGRIERIMGKIG